jgi:hypothetical protein
MPWGSLGEFWCASKKEIMMEQRFWTSSGQPALKKIRCLPVPREARFSPVFQISSRPPIEDIWDLEISAVRRFGERSNFPKR